MSFNPLYPLTEEEAEELAGHLIISSTIERYLRSIRSSGAARRVVSELRAGTIDGKELLRYGWFYRARVQETSSRSEWELPLAVIVLVLGNSGIANVEGLLVALATTQGAQGAWLAGLSRQVLASRTGSRIETSPIETRQAALEGLIIRSSADAVTPSRVQSNNSSNSRHSRYRLLEVA